MDNLFVCLKKWKEGKHIEIPWKEGKKRQGRIKAGRKEGSLEDRGTRECDKRKAKREEARLRDGKEGAQGGLSSSNFHFRVQP